MLRTILLLTFLFQTSNRSAPIFSPWSFVLSLRLYFLFHSVGWGYRICHLHLCREVKPPPPNRCPGYDITLSNGEAPVLELWGMLNTSSLLRWFPVVVVVVVVVEVVLFLLFIMGFYMRRSTLSRVYRFKMVASQLRMQDIGWVKFLIIPLSKQKKERKHGKEKAKRE